MPRSKRAKVVHLSKTAKKGKDHTLKLFGSIRDSVDAYQYCFVFGVENMRNTYLKDVRTEFGDSRLFFGKTKVMAKALGTSPEDEHAPNLSALSRHVTGTVGLLFTSREPQSILEYFSTYAPLDYARSGTVASRTFTIPSGTVYSRAGEIPVEEDVPLAHSLEVAVRKLGMPTKLVKGKVELENEYTVCTEGEVLDSSQTALLKTFGVVTAEFRVDVKAYWSAATQEVTEIGGMEVEKS